MTTLIPPTALTLDWISTLAVFDIQRFILYFYGLFGGKLNTDVTFGCPVERGGEPILAIAVSGGVPSNMHDTPSNIRTSSHPLAPHPSAPHPSAPHPSARTLQPRTLQPPTRSVAGIIIPVESSQ